jgi:death on curing protein
MIFINLQQVIEDHEEIIKIYGGLNGIRDLGLLISAIEMPKAALYGEYLHPTIYDKAAAYLFHIVCNDPFVDGNKRTGTIIALTFLKQNKIHIKFSETQSLELEEIVVNTAKGETSKVEISSFFEKCHLNSKRNRKVAIH